MRKHTGLIVKIACSIGKEEKENERVTELGTSGCYPDLYHQFVCKNGERTA